MDDVQPILQVNHLRKQFETLVAVDDVSFRVREGSCFGLLGPNGAGKTTTMEMIEGIIPATSGKILYHGVVRDSSFREEIGIQFQHTSLLNFLTVQETLVTFKALYQQPAELEELIDRCNLREVLENRNDKLSGGQLQRLMLALALINRPRLVFLDEPSTGLDPQSRRNLWRIVEQIRKEGKTVILTTHSMEEAEFLCDTVAIMDRGKIIAMDSPRALVKTHCHTSTVTLPKSAFPLPLDQLPFSWRHHNGMVEIQADQINKALSQLMALDVDLTEMVVHTANLEDVFLRITGRQLRE